MDKFSVMRFISFGSGEAIAKGLNIALFLLMPLLVSVEQFGVIAIIVASEQFLLPLLLRGQNTSIIRFGGRFGFYGDVLLKSIQSIVIIRAVYFCAAGITACAILWYFTDIDAVPAFIPLFLALPLMVNNELILADARIKDEVKHYVFSRISFQLSKFLFAVLFAKYVKVGEHAYAAALFASIALMFLYDQYKRRKSPTARINGKLGRKLLEFGTPLGLQTSINQIYSAADRYLIVGLLGMLQVSVYSLVNSIGTSVLFVANIAIISFVPQIFKLEDRDRVIVLLRRMFTFVLCAIISAGVIVYVLFYPLIIAHYPDEYDSGKNALFYILISNAFHVGYLYFFYLLTYEKQVKHIPFLTVVALFTNLISNFILIPYIGSDGAAIAKLFSELALFSLIAAYHYSHTRGLAR